MRRHTSSLVAGEEKNREGKPADYSRRGFIFIVSMFRKAPAWLVIPSLNSFHNNFAPILAKAELMNKSCFSMASAREQDGPDSFSSYKQRSIPRKIELDLYLYCR